MRRSARHFCAVFLFAFLVLISAWHFCVFAASEKPLQIEIHFPIEDFHKGPVYQQGVMGTASFLGTAGASLAGKVTVTNRGAKPIPAFRLELETGPFLNFTRPRGIDFLSTKKIFDEESLNPSETKQFSFRIENPPFQTIKKAQETTYLTASVRSEPESLPLASLHYPIRIKKSQPGLALGLVVGVTLLSLAWLGREVVHKNLTGPFGGAELLTLLMFTAFYVLGSSLGRFFQLMGAHDIVAQAFWAVYSWILILVLARLVPKPGAVSLLMILGSLLASFFTFGVDLLMLVTYTLPGAFLLELWFCVTGYGRSFFSSVGSALCYSLFPVAFFWLVMTHAVYHAYYFFPYALSWIAISAITYFVGACLGFRLANYVERRLG